MRALLILVALALAGCRSTPAPTPIPVDLLVLPNTPVSTAVNEYFHYRKLAILARDPQIVWSRYPDLGAGEDVQRGINTEGWYASRSAASASLADVDYDLERFERIHFLARSADEAVVRVGALERYVAKDFSDGKAGELLLDLYLRRDGERWTV